MNNMAIGAGIKVFNFSPENQKVIAKIFAKYPPEQKMGALMPLLTLAQKQCGGWLPRAALEEIAEMLSCTVLKVLEVASFYTMYNLQPVGKYHLKVCTTTPCWLNGSQDIVLACKNILGTEPEGVSDDGLFSYKEVECLGACVNAPVVQVNDDYHENLTGEKLKELIDSLKS
jgi:NADH-quinone oxidoreductase subunit E